MSWRGTVAMYPCSSKRVHALRFHLCELPNRRNEFEAPVGTKEWVEIGKRRPGFQEAGHVLCVCFFFLTRVVVAQMCSFLIIP